MGKRLPCGPSVRTWQNETPGNVNYAVTLRARLRVRGIGAEWFAPFVRRMAGGGVEVAGFTDGPVPRRLHLHLLRCWELLRL
jgi:hypothetical protein